MRKQMRSMVVAAMLGAAAAPLMAAVALPVFAQTAAGSIGIDNFTFTPQRMTVRAGTTIKWTNKDDIPHAIASVGKVFRSKTLDTDDSYEFTFTTPGTYDYFCSLHPHMTGTVVVTSDVGDNAGQ
jgi:plastocyanin